MYGRQPRLPDVPRLPAFDPTTYADQPTNQPANLAIAAEQQKAAYDQRSSPRTLRAGDLVWLSVPTAGKLDPKWEGDWKVQSVKSPLNVELTVGRVPKWCISTAYVTHLAKHKRGRFNRAPHGKLASNGDRPTGPPSTMPPTSAIPWEGQTTTWPIWKLWDELSLGRGVCDRPVLYLP